MVCKKLMTADEPTRMPYGQVVVIRQRSYPIKSKLVPYSLLYKKTKTSLAEIAKTAMVKIPVRDTLYIYSRNVFPVKAEAKKEKTLTDKEIKQHIMMLDMKSMGKLKNAMKDKAKNEIAEIITKEGTIAGLGKDEKREIFDYILNIIKNK